MSISRAIGLIIQYSISQVGNERWTLPTGMFGAMLLAHGPLSSGASNRRRVAVRRRTDKPFLTSWLWPSFWTRNASHVTPL